MILNVLLLFLLHDMSDISVEIYLTEQSAGSLFLPVGHSLTHS